MQQEAPGGVLVSVPLADLVQEDPGKELVPVQVFPCQSRPGDSQQAQEVPGKVPVPVQVVDLAQEALGKVLLPVWVVHFADLAQEAPGKVPVPVQVVPLADLASILSASARKEGHPRSEANMTHLRQLCSYLQCDPAASL
jgi:hypothetical protein